MELQKAICNIFRRLSGPESKQLKRQTPNEEFVKLCEDLAELVLMYDRMQSRLQNPESKDLAKDFCLQIIRFLSLSKECTIIGREPTFDSRLHVPVPFAFVENGTPIDSIVRIGIAIGDYVLIPAKVKVIL